MARAASALPSRWRRERTLNEDDVQPSRTEPAAPRPIQELAVQSAVASFCGVTMRVGPILQTIAAALAVVALGAALEPAPAAATDEPAGDGTITTVLHPGWNMVGWVSPETSASDLFEQIPELAGISAWDSEAGGYQRRHRPTVRLLDPLRLAPGWGLWLYLDGKAPVEWTREPSEDTVLIELQAGRNLVAWAGRDGTPLAGSCRSPW